MSKEEHIFLRHISAIYRNTIRYLDLALEDTELGCSQQFFLSYIHEQQGITMYDLAKTGNFDKGTITKSIQKLVNMDCVSISPDERDKRVKHLYTTVKGEQLIDQIYKARQDWKSEICCGFSADELAILSSLLKKMDLNSRDTLKLLNTHKRKEEISNEYREKSFRL